MGRPSAAAARLLAPTSGLNDAVEALLTCNSEALEMATNLLVRYVGTRKRALDVIESLKPEKLEQCFISAIAQPDSSSDDSDQLESEELRNKFLSRRTQSQQWLHGAITLERCCVTAHLSNLAVVNGSLGEAVRWYGEAKYLLGLAIVLIGRMAERSRNAAHAADALHVKKGSRSKLEEIRRIWADGNYTSRANCAIEEHAAVGLSLDRARKALQNTDDPRPWPAKQRHLKKHAK